jgi:hypothetical protein
MSTLEVILIVVGVLIVLLFIGGLIAVRRRDRQEAPVFDEHVRAADAALEQARALDRGWDRVVMEEAARGALRDRRPDFPYDDLHLVLVDDQPGVDEDRAHFVAVGPDGQTRVVLARTGDHWGPESVE